jgi:hypothetical protein
LVTDQRAKESDMQAALSTLRDVEGVMGSFVIDGEGSVLARDMPSMVDDGALSYAGRRLIRIALSVEALGKRADQYSLRFGSFLLVARAAHPVTLCVLLSGTSNVTALHMGTTLVARRVQSEHREAQERARMQLHEEPTKVQRAPVLPAPKPSSLPPPSSLKASFFARPSPAKAAEKAPESEPSEGPDAPSPTRFFRGRPV